MTSTKTRKTVATLAATAALAIVPAAAEAATYSTSGSGTATTYVSGATSASAPQRASGTTTPMTGTHAGPTGTSTIRVSEAYSSGQAGSASDEWCEQAADLANYFHDRAVDGYNAGSGDEFYDRNMAVSDDIADQAENAGCVVVY